MDKTQLSAAIIAFSLLMLVSPWGLSKAITGTNVAAVQSQFIGAISILVMFYAIVFLVAGIAVLYVKEEKEEVKEVMVNA
jgi:hypothetical protein